MGGCCRRTVTDEDDQNLAYAEMRLVLAKTIWPFDLELAPESDNWMGECKVMSLWVKPKLMVKVSEVVQDKA
jgi:hypothetical protein